jgi:hypothetical protein
VVDGGRYTRERWDVKILRRGVPYQINVKQKRKCGGITRHAHRKQKARRESAREEETTIKRE